MAKVIYLMRHGETNWNYVNKFQTHSNGVNNTLNEKGISQVSFVAELFKDEQIDHAFYSPLERSRQTLDLVLQYHPETNREECNDLREISLYFLDGLNQQEWESKYPQTKHFFEAREQNKFGCEIPDVIDLSTCYEESIRIARENGEVNKTIPDWENYGMAMDRVSPFVDKINNLEGTVLISGHQGINRAIIGKLLGESKYIDSIESIAYLKTPNSAVFKIEQGTLSHNRGQGWIEGLIN
jgi:broad specificity phosphatase PhoE